MIEIKGNTTDKILYVNGFPLTIGDIEFNDPDMTWDKFYNYVVELDKKEEEQRC
ncbi:hypothetical protein G8S55_11565 [Clostridium botulinum C]|uniref:hypothetical protein n=1 Tax=Clostridium botulinum TaxID=1491 RepID=UPI001E2BEC07|nr:hypothetical protein [Clostridium botulinum]MCD3217855.1 hypothetical protein [Clostridium botulinum C]